MSEISLNNLQTQVNSKANGSHTHTTSDITDFPVTSGGSTVTILTGTVAHGGTIPLPTGYTQAQCKWFVSPNSILTGWSDSSGGGDSSPTTYYVLGTIQCFADANRVVTARLYIDAYSYRNGTANYMIIGTK